MCLARRVYEILVEILHKNHELEAGASQLQSDRVIANRFGVSESTARNWRRCRHTQIAPATMSLILRVVAEIAPEQTAQLELLDRLQHGTQEVKTAAESLVERLSEEVLGHDATWHIYSGPLRMAFDLAADQGDRQQLMRESAMIMERILEMRIDQTNVPAVSELIRYSTHGWYLKGFLKIREQSLNSQIAGLQDGYLSPVEVALYVGDGCATPSFFGGQPERAFHYTEQALHMLADARASREEAALGVTVADATIMIRSIQTLIACYWNFDQHEEIVRGYERDLGTTVAQTDWIEGTRQEVLGCIELARRNDYAKAAHHFNQAGIHLDRWIEQFGIPFSTTSPQSLMGYSLLMTHGPSQIAQLHISEGLLRTIDLGNIAHQIRARLCQARFYECQGAEQIARFHRDKALELVQQHNLMTWYDMLNHLLLPVNVTSPL